MEKKSNFEVGIEEAPLYCMLVGIRDEATARHGNRIDFRPVRGKATFLGQEVDVRVGGIDRESDEWQPMHVHIDYKNNDGAIEKEWLIIDTDRGLYRQNPQDYQFYPVDLSEEADYIDMLNSFHVDDMMNEAD